MSTEEVTIVPITPAEVTFHEATSEERKQSWAVNGISWAGPLSNEQYVDREFNLSLTELARNGGTKYWVLTRKADGELVAACESTLKSVLIADRKTGYREVKAYAIASVYTPAKFRKQGMAGYLLGEFKRWVDGEDATEISVLYSDIGTSFYSKLGWAVFPYKQVAIEISNRFSPEKASLFTSTKPIKLEDIRELCERDKALMKKRFQSIHDKEKTHITFTSSFPQVSWHLIRTEFMAKILLNKIPQIKGAITESGKSWIYWDHDLRAKELVIIRLVSENHNDAPQSVVEDAEALLTAAVKEAVEWDIPKVCIWNPDKLISDAANNISGGHDGSLQTVYEDRGDHAIPSLRWREDKPVDDVVWDFNEYYAWC